MLKRLNPIISGLFIILIMTISVVFSGNVLANGYSNIQNQPLCTLCHLGDRVLTSNMKEVIILSKGSIHSEESNRYSKYSYTVNDSMETYVVDVVYKVPWQYLQV